MLLLLLLWRHWWRHLPRHARGANRHWCHARFLQQVQFRLDSCELELLSRFVFATRVVPTLSTYDFLQQSLFVHFIYRNKCLLYSVFLVSPFLQIFRGKNATPKLLHCIVYYSFFINKLVSKFCHNVIFKELERQPTQGKFFTRGGGRQSTQDELSVNLVFQLFVYEP